MRDGGQIGASSHAHTAFPGMLDGRDGGDFVPMSWGTRQRGGYPAQLGSLSVLSSMLDRCLDALRGLRFVGAVVFGG